MNQSELIAKAIEARGNAHAPYSNFKVGAAVLTASGNIYKGCNVENAAYPVTCCAERTAIFTAVTAGDHEFKAIAVTANTEEPVPPCGSCRQVMAEFFTPSTPVIMTNLSGKVKIVQIKDLLPFSFDAGQLGEAAD